MLHKIFCLPVPEVKVEPSTMEHEQRRAASFIRIVHGNAIKVSFHLCTFSDQFAV
jgi:hypothetical protein